MQRFFKKKENSASTTGQGEKTKSRWDIKGALMRTLNRNRAALNHNQRLENINTSDDLSPTETVNMADNPSDYCPSPKNETVSTEAANSSQSTTPRSQSKDQYTIKNIDTGEAFDLRTEQEKPQDKVVFQGTPWNKFWKNIRKSNESLWDAAESGDSKAVTDLLDSKKQTYPAEIDSKALDDWTALHMAVNCGHVSVVEILLNHNANIEAKTSMLRTPLHLSCMRGNIEIVKLLVNCQASINSTDHELNTSLHYASEHGFPDIVSFLLDRNPDIFVKNIHNLTCIDVTNSVEIRKIFEDKGFINENHIVKSFGRTYIDDSILYNGRSDIIGKLLSFNHHNMKYLERSYLNNSIRMMQKRSIKDQADLNKPVATEPEKIDSPVQVPVKKEESIIQKEDSIKQSIQELKPTTASIKIEKDESPQKVPVPQSMTESAEKKKDITFSNIKIETFLKGSENPAPTEERIGPKSFIKHDTLGKGSFGEVYLVEKISDGRLFAMKVLKKDRILNQNLTRYAKTERNVLSVMDHPFIVKLNYAFQTETKLYLFLDYCPGGDMGNLIGMKTKIPEKVAKIYAAEITLALEALHNKDIIFRDLKPDNVVLDKDGHACLTDFGLSKEGMKEGLTKSFLGSIAYLAPEILTKAGHNKTVDWYLLGVLIYEMLVGVPPYFNRDRAKLFENIKSGQLKIPKSLSEGARSILILLLKRDPSKRLGYQKDAEEIKKHPWFADIDWNDALARKLVPPPLENGSDPQLNKLVNRKIDDVQETGDRKNFIEGWSFVKQT